MTLTPRLRSGTGVAPKNLPFGSAQGRGTETVAILVPERSRGAMCEANRVPERSRGAMCEANRVPERSRGVKGKALMFGKTTGSLMPVEGKTFKLENLTYISRNLSC
jgi:hypothetical protein